MQKDVHLNPILTRPHPTVNMFYLELFDLVTIHLEVNRGSVVRMVFFQVFGSGDVGDTFAVRLEDRVFE